MKKTQYHLLKTKRFLPLFITQFFNAFNDNIFKNALVILITYKITQSVQSNVSMIAIIGGIFILPFFLFSATAGQIADKFEKSFLIKIIKFLEIIFMLVGSIGFILNNVFLLMLTLFFLGAHSTFFGPIKYSILPDHLSENELIGGNALIEAGTFIAILVGQILGGSLILLWQGPLLISATLMCVALLGFAASFFIPKTHIGQPSLSISFNILKETWQIFKITHKKKDVYLAILGISWFWFVGATLLTQFPPFVKDILHSTVSVFTLFLTVFSLGIGVGSLLCNYLLKGQISARYVPIAVLGMSIFMADIYFATQNLQSTMTSLVTLKEFFSSIVNLRILIDILVLTIFGGLFTVPFYAIIQERSDEAERSRTVAGNNILNALFMVLSAVFILMTTWLNLSIPQTFLLVAICNLFVAIYICKRRDILLF